MVFYSQTLWQILTSLFPISALPSPLYFLPPSLLPSLWVTTSQYSTYFPGGGGTFLQCRGGEVSVSLFLPLPLVSISLSLVFRVGCLSVTLFSEGATEGWGSTLFAVDRLLLSGSGTKVRLFRAVSISKIITYVTTVEPHLMDTRCLRYNGQF